MDLGKLEELGRRRKCVTCGAVFEGDKGAEGLTAMQKHVDHLREHQETVAQWTNAYQIIRRGMGKV